MSSCSLTVIRRLQYTRGGSKKNGEKLTTLNFTNIHRRDFRSRKWNFRSRKLKIVALDVISILNFHYKASTSTRNWRKAVHNITKGQDISQKLRRKNSAARTYAKIVVLTSVCASRQHQQNMNTVPLKLKLKTKKKITNHKACQPPREKCIAPRGVHRQM